MASSTLLSVLAKIPWGQVVESAPMIAQGATRLWENVRQRRQAAAAPEDLTPASPEQVDEPAVLQARLLQLQAQVISLQDEMRSSAEVVKQLADQNEQLVARLEAMDRRIGRQAVLGALALAGLAVALAVVLLR